MGSLIVATSFTHNKCNKEIPSPTEIPMEPMKESPTTTKYNIFLERNFIVTHHHHEEEGAFLRRTKYGWAFHGIPERLLPLG